MVDNRRSMFERHAEEIQKLLNRTLKLQGENKQKQLIAESIYEGERLKAIKHKDNQGNLVNYVVFKNGFIILQTGSFDDNENLLKGKILKYEIDKLVECDFTKEGKYYRGKSVSRNSSGKILSSAEGLFNDKIILNGKMTKYKNGESYIFEYDLVEEGEYYRGTITLKYNNGILITKSIGLHDKTGLLIGEKIKYDRYGNKIGSVVSSLQREGNQSRGVMIEQDAEGKPISRYEGLWKDTGDFAGGYVSSYDFMGLEKQKVKYDVAANIEYVINAEDMIERQLERLKDTTKLGFDEFDLTRKKGLERFRNNVKEKFCFIGKDCSKDIIGAHSIQNNGVLSKIAHNSEVLVWISVDKFNGTLIKLIRDGKKSATTFTGFCGKHDKIFSPIEDKAYMIGNPQQEFLFAYRNLAYEYCRQKEMHKQRVKLYNWIQEYKKTGTVKELTKNNNYVNLLDLVGNEYFIKNFIDYYKEILEKLEAERIEMNTGLEQGFFDIIQTDKIEFDEEYLVAVSSACPLIVDLNGKLVSEPDNPKDIRRMFLTILPQNGKTYVLFSYFKEDARKFNFIKDQILNKSPGEQKVILSNIIAVYCNNIAISPESWGKVGDVQRKDFIKTKNTASLGKLIFRNLIINPELNIFV